MGLFGCEFQKFLLSPSIMQITSQKKVDLKIPNQLFLEKFTKDYICVYGRTDTEILYLEFVAWLSQIQ